MEQHCKIESDYPNETMGTAYVPHKASTPYASFYNTKTPNAKRPIQTQTSETNCSSNPWEAYLSQNTQNSREPKKSKAGCVFCYIDGYGQIFILLVYQKESHFYGFPKGTIEDGETPEECAKREVGEEIKWNIQGVQFGKSFTFKHHTYYFVRLKKPFNCRVDQKEIGKFTWKPIDDIQEKTVSKFTWKILGEVKQFLRGLQIMEMPNFSEVSKVKEDSYVENPNIRWGRSV
jgi:8-oxo-dGTP pyrophosphatase MutT (NUDIX family)